MDIHFDLLIKCVWFTACYWQWPLFAVNPVHGNCFVCCTFNFHILLHYSNCYLVTDSNHIFVCSFLLNNADNRPTIHYSTTAMTWTIRFLLCRYVLESRHIDLFGFSISRAPNCACFVIDFNDNQQYQQINKQPRPCENIDILRVVKIFSSRFVWWDFSIWFVKSFLVFISYWFQVQQLPKKRKINDDKSRNR